MCYILDHNISKKKSSFFSMSLLCFAMSLLLFDRLWGYIFRSTVFASTPMVYLLFITVLLLFLIVVFRGHLGKLNNMALIWMPYIVATLLGYLFMLKLQSVTYWFACMVMIIVAPASKFLNDFPIRFILWSGLICMLGVFIQLFFPSFYDSGISNLIISDNIERWVEEYGYNGFTSQLGITADILIYGEAALLFMRKELLSKFLRRKWIYYLFVILFVVSVFLTGKRLLAALALVLPFIVYFFSNRRSFGKFEMILTADLVAIGGYYVLSQNVGAFMDNVILRRFADTYMQASSGVDITSGRSSLAKMALDAYRDYPIFGIGVNNFKSYTGAQTDVHNTYLQVLCEQGIVGFTIFIIPIVFCFIRTCQLFKKRLNSQHISYLKMSLALQLIYITYCFTGNENLGAGFVLYYMGVALMISVESQYKKLLR